MAKKKPRRLPEIPASARLWFEEITDPVELAEYERRSKEALVAPGVGDRPLSVRTILAFTDHLQEEELLELIEGFTKRLSPLARRRLQRQRQKANGRKST
jgi:hypothetical protein